MAIKYVTVNGQKVSAGCSVALGKLNAAFKKAFNLSLVVSSGYRSHAEQTKIFKARYRVQATGSGPYNDVRWWNGQRWVRHSSAGTVAQPGTSRHEKAGAVDFRDTGRDAGVTVRNTKRSNWLRKNGPKYGFQPTGFSFGEPWHYDYNGAHDAPSGGSKPSILTVNQAAIEEDEDMPVVITNSAKDEWSLLDPDVGTDLPRFTGNAAGKYRSEKVTGGVVNTYRGFMVTTSKAVADTWGRSYCRAYGNAPQKRLGGDYKNAQVEASRLADEKHRK